jgi:hypothetical protein
VVAVAGTVVAGAVDAIVWVEGPAGVAPAVRP